jgi:hypothetical protein
MVFLTQVSDNKRIPVNRLLTNFNDLANLREEIRKGIISPVIGDLTLDQQLWTVLAMHVGFIKAPLKQSEAIQEPQINDEPDKMGLKK